jgi:hypothetical protein
MYTQTRSASYRDGDDVVLGVFVFIVVVDESRNALVSAHGLTIHRALCVHTFAHMSTFFSANNDLNAMQVDECSADVIYFLFILFIVCA